MHGSTCEMSHVCVKQWCSEHLQKATGALWFTDALFWRFPSTKPLLGRSEQRAAETFPGDQLGTEQDQALQHWEDIQRCVVKQHHH